MRLTQQQFDSIKQKRPARGKPKPRQPTPGLMNKLEAAFLNNYIKPRIHTGEYIDATFEAVKLRLAKATFYTPDFLVVTSEEFIFFEVKGFWRDDARAKIKVAADKYPHFRFIAVQKAPAKDGGWKFEDFEPA